MTLITVLNQIPDLGESLYLSIENLYDLSNINAVIMCGVEL